MKSIIVNEFAEQLWLFTRWCNYYKLSKCKYKNVSNMRAK